MKSSVERRRAGAFYDSVLLAPSPAEHADPGVDTGGPGAVTRADGPDGGAPASDPGDASDGAGEAFSASLLSPSRRRTGLPATRAWPDGGTLAEDP